MGSDETSRGFNWNAPNLPVLFSSPNTSQLAARMKVRRTLVALAKEGEGFENLQDTSELCSEELIRATTHLRKPARNDASGQCCPVPQIRG